MVTEDDVLFEIVSDSVSVVPITTAPKFRVLLPSATVLLFELPDRPWHPVSSKRPPAITREMAKRLCKE